MQLPQQLKKKKRQVMMIAAGVLMALILAFAFGLFGSGTRSMNYVKLRCVAEQDVTPFGDSVLYYDNTTLFCLSAKNTEKWKVSLGSNAGFSVGPNNVVAWVGRKLFILDKNGRSTYNDEMSDVIQFARVGSRYTAIVLGSNISPQLVILDMNGLLMDSETNAYADMLMLDVGFFGNGEYVWTTSMDVYGTVPSTIMHTFTVNDMNTGEVSLGEQIAYKIIYAGTKLHVISTRQLRLYDYRGTIDNNGTVLVYGWQLVDDQVSGSNATLLFAPSRQTADMTALTELRVLSGKTDKRYTLPSACVGAAIYNKKVYAFAADAIYRADLSAQRFLALSMPMGSEATGYLGMLSGGVALITCDSDVYAVTLP